MLKLSHTHIPKTKVQENKKILDTISLKMMGQSYRSTRDNKVMDVAVRQIF